jgi:hypothetical protein
VFTARYELNLRVMYINPSKPSGHYMYRQFNTQHFYVLPTQCIYVFCVDLRTNSDYFPKYTKDPARQLVQFSATRRQSNAFF